MEKKSNVDNTARRKWDRDEFEKKAAERDRAEEVPPPFPSRLWPHSSLFSFCSPPLHA